MEKKYNFGENAKEYYKGQYLDVVKTPKYNQSKEKVISLIDSANFKNVLSEDDFWILMTTDKNATKMFYTGLIINHEALIKINDKLIGEDKFDQKYCSEPIESTYKGKQVLRMEYRDERDGMFEVGEISEANCKNEYPYAMLLKRVFDRVVKRKAKLGYVYSDSEAEEFNQKINIESDTKSKATDSQLQIIKDNADIVNIENIDLDKISVLEASQLCKTILEKKEGKK